MAVNRYQPHLVVVLEDAPYREIMNGIKGSVNVNEQLIDVKHPAGGWTKVLDSLTEQERLLSHYRDMHLLLLIDYDHQFESRYALFQQAVQEKNYEHRVFMLGVDDKQSEDLKSTLGHIHLEALGQALVENCPQVQHKMWQNKHLACNQRELDRMRVAGVFEWLFLK